MIWSQPAVRIAVALTAPLLTMALIGATLERFWPAAARRRDRGAVNLTAWGALIFCQGAIGPALGGVVTLALNAAGGGLVVLPAHGWGLALSLAVYFVAMDLGEYLFHRAQHAIPWMWAMHSLHHSDPDFDATTAARHFWLEPAIKTVSIWLAVAVAFRTPPVVVLVWIVVSYWHYVVHSNSRLDFGRWTWALNGPAYHRLHHSRLAEHFDVNFAALFPIFDVALGSYRRPVRGQVVPTGLDTGEAPQTPWQALSWPLRGRLSKLGAGSLAAAGKPDRHARPQSP